MRRTFPAIHSSLKTLPALLVVVPCFQVVPAQEVSRYRLPAPEIVEILEYEPPPEALVGPDGRQVLLTYARSLPSIGEVSRPMVRVAGKRIDTQSNAPIVVLRERIYRMALVDIESGQELAVKTPDSGDIGNIRWSPDGRQLAFTVTLRDGGELWLADASTGKCQRLGKGLNLAAGGADWAPDSRWLVCHMIPGSRPAPPVAPSAPLGPVIRETLQEPAQNPTYQDLLRSPFDAELYEHYLTSRLARVAIAGGEIQYIGDAGIYANAAPSPDGRFLLIEEIQRPFSYLVPERYFPRTVEVWDVSGKRVREIARLPLAEDVPIQGVRKGPRRFGWVSSQPATLHWVEALDEGNPKKDAEFRDRLVLLPSPFRQNPVELLRTVSRFDSVWWTSDNRALVSEVDRRKQWKRMQLAPLSGGGSSQARLLWELSSQDGYRDPGEPVSTMSPTGFETVRVQEGSIFLKGRGSSPEGDLPFLDRLGLASGETERVFQSAPGTYEQVVALLGASGPRILTRFESRLEAPNFFARDLGRDSARKLTTFGAPSPKLREITVQLISYRRVDGLELSGRLYLPAGYREGERLPVVIWAYPREYNDPGIAAQVRGSPNRFLLLSGASHLFFLTQGYAVLDGPSMPIVGEEGNDRFVEQLVMNAKGAVDKLVEMGVADPHRIGIGGHSYGAFMTANLLAHTDFFAAGIARSGAYNRTLTPFGFQNERRSLWEVPDVYFTMSPFMHVDGIREPILLVHGELDNNSGTFPLQSERLFNAIKGSSGTSRFVLLPAESHGYVARESVLEVIAEMVDWFDKYVKNRPAPEAAMEE